MQLELKKIKAENAALAQKVQAGRESITQTEHRISAAVEEWKVREKQWKMEKKTMEKKLHTHKWKSCGTES